MSPKELNPGRSRKRGRKLAGPGGAAEVPPLFFLLADHTLTFGFRVARFVVANAIPEPLGGAGPRGRETLPRRESEFVSCLINGADERLTFDLRMVSQPNPANPAAGKVAVGILARARDLSVHDTELYGLTLGNLLQALFPELEFAPMSEGEVHFFLRPFVVRHGILITRRWGWQPLDSLRGGSRQKPPIGFGEQKAGDPPSRSRSAVFHVFSFSSAFAAMDGFFRLLLMHPWPCLASVRLRPTRLYRGEEAFLEGEIALCERFAQVSLDRVPEEVRLLQPTLQQRARLHQDRLLGKLYALKDDACLMSIELLSPNPVPQLLADAWGHLITRPASDEARSGTGSCLDGGYETVKLDDISTVAANSADLELTVPPPDPETGRLLYLFDASEAACAFRFPLAPSEGLPGTEVRRFRVKDLPPSIPQTGVRFALGFSAGRQVPACLAEEDRLRHVYIVGQTGTGKTTVLRQMILNDIRQGKGVCVIDPHGDLFAELLGLIPESRADDVVVIDPTDELRSVGLNLLELDRPDERHFVTQQFTDIIGRLLEDEFGSGATLVTGPIFYYHMRMGTLLACSNPKRPGTILDVFRIFTIPGYWRRFWDESSSDLELSSYVSASLTSFAYDKRGSEGITLGEYIFSKLGKFVFDPRVRCIFGQQRSTIRFREAMDKRKIVLVNLAKGLLSEGTSRFLGMVVLAKLQAAAMGRVALPAHRRRPFYVYVDEFQSMATESFVTLLSEGRKFGLGLVLANQFVSQLKQERIVHSIFGNVGTLMAFRVGAVDAEVLEPYFKPYFSSLDLTSLPNWHAIVRLLVNNQSESPFTAVTVPPTERPALHVAADVRDRSAKKYTQSRTDVERELERVHVS